MTNDALFRVGLGVKGYCHLRPICRHSPLEYADPTHCSLFTLSMGLQIVDRPPWHSSHFHPVGKPLWGPCNPQSDCGNQDHGLWFCNLSFFCVQHPPHNSSQSQRFFRSLPLSVPHPPPTHTHFKKAHHQPTSTVFFFSLMYIWIQEIGTQGGEKTKSLKSSFSLSSTSFSFPHQPVQRGRFFLSPSMSSP